MCVLACVCTLTAWCDEHHTSLWISQQSQQALIKSRNEEMETWLISEARYKQAQQENHFLVERANAEKAMAQSRAFAQVASGTAHDMRTPVRALQSGCRDLQIQHTAGNHEEMPQIFHRMFAGLPNYMRNLS